MDDLDAGAPDEFAYTGDENRMDISPDIQGEGLEMEPVRFLMQTASGDARERDLVAAFMKAR